MESLRFYCQWRTAITAENCCYYFPNPLSAEFRAKYCGPAIYRWRVMKNAGGQKEPIYIGECEDLERRMRHVLTPGKSAKAGNTNARLSLALQGYFRTGRLVVIDIADITSFQMNGHIYGHDAIGDRFKRRALENMLVVEAENDPNFELLNVTFDSVEKMRSIVASLPPSALKEIIKKRARGRL